MRGVGAGVRRRNDASGGGQRGRFDVIPIAATAAFRNALPMNGRVALGVAFVSLLVPAQAAEAATVAVRGTPNGLREMVFVAAAGEQNDVVLGDVPSSANGPIWTVRDSGAVLVPGDACEAVDTHAARCRLGGIAEVVRLHLGDMGDRLNAVAGYIPKVVADGGPGDDRLVGGIGWPVLRGGPGDDEIDTSGVDGDLSLNVLDGGRGNDRLLGGGEPEELHGGGGRDKLHGGGGDDTLIDDDADGAAGASGPGPDSFDGGTGVDVVGYARRTASLFVDLANPATDGERGEGDRLKNVESVVGGRGDDRLAGDGLPNMLDGHRGRDRLIGRDGADELRRAEGRVNCGDQRDRVAWHRRSQAVLAADCEYLALPHPIYGGEKYVGVTATPVTASRTSVRFRVWCPPDDFDPQLEEAIVGRCGPGRLRMRETRGDRRTVAIGHLPAGRWYGRRVTARLTPLGRRLATRRDGVRARVRLTGYFSKGPLAWTIRLKVPR